MEKLQRVKGWRVAPSPARFILSDPLGCGGMSEAILFSSVLSSEMGCIEPSWGVRWATRQWYDDSGMGVDQKSGPGLLWFWTTLCVVHGQVTCLQGLFSTWRSQVSLTG